eukprot:TRINITY_DN13136_c0_g1_i2.p1 TRINITY_DN13136_c0_g1~~TRINITY_DN13136_c0_g1_i2.p1  ORF type:complete len:256 (+),score=52.20 TRINITY_DN13136_c0_g1_i2:60-827(+)
MPRAVFISQDIYLAQIEQLKKKRLLLAPRVLGPDDSTKWNEPSAGFLSSTHEVKASGDNGSNSDSTRFQSEESGHMTAFDSFQQSFGSRDDEFDTVDGRSKDSSIEDVPEGKPRKEGKSTKKKNRASKVDAMRAHRRQVRVKDMFVEDDVFSQGTHCSARKHLRLGCAVITFSSVDVQAKAMAYARKMSSDEKPTWSFGPFVASLQPHHDSATKSIDEASIFAFWGRQIEKGATVPAPVISEAFDRLYEEALWCM